MRKLKIIFEPIGYIKKIFKPLFNLKVSSHFLIRRTGSLIQFVSLKDRAWHAGESSFLGKVGCNDFSIGIEVEGTDFEKFNDAQYDTLENLIISIKNFLPGLSCITSHSLLLQAGNRSGTIF